MFCRLVTLRLLNCVTETSQLIEGRMLESPDLKYGMYLYTTLLVEIFEDASPNFCKLKKILSRANRDIEEQNIVLESSINYY
jgi:hypothetical protein